MLYVSTRDRNASVTAYTTLHTDFASDGGAFMPIHLPVLEEKELLSLGDMTCCQRILEILRRFYPLRISGSDLELYIGRSPIKIREISRRILIAEVWHNPQRDYAHIVQEVYRLLCGGTQMEEKPTDWSGIAVRIAVLFGIYGELLRQSPSETPERIDISVSADDFSVAVAAWYAKKMGLPIGTILCSCNTSSALWDLIRHGECSVQSIKSGNASFLTGIEHLLHGTLGTEEVQHFVQCCQKPSAYVLSANKLKPVRCGLFPAVIGDDRINSVIISVYQTSGYRLDRTAAVSYGGLQDYRASTGESRLTLLLSDREVKQ